MKQGYRLCELCSRALHALVSNGIKNDLIMYFECVADYGTEDDYKYRELAKLTHPLETLFVDWCKREDDHMENLRYSIEETANKSLRDIIVNQNNKDLELDDYER